MTLTDISCLPVSDLYQAAVYTACQHADAVFVISAAATAIATAAPLPVSDHTLYALPLFPLHVGLPQLHVTLREHALALENGKEALRDAVNKVGICRL